MSGIVVDLDGLVANQPGYVGAFTREQYQGAWPNGSRVRKVKEDEGGDATPLGTLGTVLGSVGHPRLKEQLYFVEWDGKPKMALACMSTKLEMVT